MIRTRFLGSVLLISILASLLIAGCGAGAKPQLRSEPTSSVQGIFTSPDGMNRYVIKSGKAEFWTTLGTQRLAAGAIAHQYVVTVKGERRLVWFVIDFMDHARMVYRTDFFPDLQEHSEVGKYTVGGLEGVTQRAILKADLDRLAHAPPGKLFLLADSLPVSLDGERVIISWQQAESALLTDIGYDMQKDVLALQDGGHLLVSTVTDTKYVKE